jgi:hypothetical protein
MLTEVGLSVNIAFSYKESKRLGQSNHILRP